MTAPLTCCCVIVTFKVSVVWYFSHQSTLQTFLSCWWRKKFGALFVVVQVQNSDVSPTIFFRVLIPLIPKEICSREVRTLLKTFSTQNLRLFSQEIAW
jgi:hypothetical protein